MVMQCSVTPVYRFFNGRSRFYEFGTPAVADASGRVLMAGPLGSRTEPGAKITALKRHEGRQPIDPVTREVANELLDGNAIFYSDFMGVHQKLPNGNELIAVPSEARILEVSAKGDMVMEFNNLPPRHLLQ